MAPNRTAGFLSLTSAPAGIRVQIDDLEPVTTPASVELAPGTHRVRSLVTVVDGKYYDQTPEQLISVAAGSSLLLPLNPAVMTAEVQFLRLPATGRLFIDGTLAGPAASHRQTVPLGMHEFRFERPGAAAVTWTKLVSGGGATLVWGTTADQAYRPPKKAIALDGRVDTWAGIEPVFDLAVSTISTRAPTFLGSSDAGFARVYLARDDRYLYWRIDFTGTNPYLTPPPGVKGKLSSLTSVQVKPGFSRFFMLDYDPRTKSGTTESTIKEEAADKFTDWVTNSVVYKQSAAMVVERAELSQILKFGAGPYLFSTTLAEAGWKNTISTPELFLDLTP